VYQFVDCVRCGFTFEITKKQWKPKMLCASCKTRKVVVIEHGDTRCLPWHGQFGYDLVTPVDELGKPVLPGERSCGNLDCVQESHIVRKES
jgi:hypothetical protein